MRGTEGLASSWDRRDRIEIAVLLAAVSALHLAGFTAVALAVTRSADTVGAHRVGIGLAVTAYLLGLRHAFDADHIAAIDNTTRKLISPAQALQRKPTAVGFWFALGHSSVVLAMAALVVYGVQAVGPLLDDTSSARRALGLTGTLVSGLFLYLVAAANMVALTGILRALRRQRAGSPYRTEDLGTALDGRGLLARALRPVLRRITSPVQMYPVGALFGLGFDTASEVALLALAGGGTAAGLPWYGVAGLALLFAAGMTLLDTADGVLMTAAYRWAFLRPARRIYYNLALTALSVAAALLIGSIELVSILRDTLHG